MNDVIQPLLDRLIAILDANHALIADDPALRDNAAAFRSNCERWQVEAELSSRYPVKSLPAMQTLIGALASALEVLTGLKAYDSLVELGQTLLRYSPTDKVEVSVESTLSFAEGLIAQRRHSVATSIIVPLEGLIGDEPQDAVAWRLYHALAEAYLGSNSYQEARHYCIKSMHVAQVLQDAQYRAISARDLGISLARLGEFTEAAELLQESLALFLETKNVAGQCRVLIALGACRRHIGDIQGALFNLGEGLHLAEQIGHLEWQAGACMNLAGVFHDRKDAIDDLESAARLFTKAADLFNGINDNYNAAIALSNVGSVLMEQGDFSGAYEFFTRSLTTARENGNLATIAWAQTGLAAVAVASGSHPAAFERFEEAIVIFQGIGQKYQLSRVLMQRAQLYCVLSQPLLALDDLARVKELEQEMGNMAHLVEAASFEGSALFQLGRFSEALELMQSCPETYFEGLSHVVASFHFAWRLKILMAMDSDGEALRRANSLMEDHQDTFTLVLGDDQDFGNKGFICQTLADLAASNGDWQTALEMTEKANSASMAEQKRSYRDAYHRYVIETEIELRNAILAQKEASSRELLDRLLPAGIGSRILRGENAIAEQYDTCSVMLMDIANFTNLAAQTDNRDLVQFLHELFGGVDALCQKHGVEKIKTMGDAYIACAGVPDPCDDHADRIARCALEVIEFVRVFRVPHTSPALQQESCDIVVRIGLHSGPVIAGILGSYRFQYDILGNILYQVKELESTCQPGRVHCSQEFRELCSPGFTFTDNPRREEYADLIPTTFWLTGETQKNSFAPSALPEL